MNDDTLLYRVISSDMKSETAIKIHITRSKQQLESS